MSTVPSEDLWALWPDGTMCNVEDVESQLSPPCAMSDDYEMVVVTEYTDCGNPIAWITK